MNSNVSASRLSLSAALRQVLIQIVRLLEEEDPAPLLREGSALNTALESWRKTVAAQTSGASTQRARELEQAKLEMMAKAAQLQKERDDLQLRNKEILAELVKSKKFEEKSRQQLLQAQFTGSGHRAEARALDLEVRELRRRVRELEGGPPLTAVEAAPQSKVVRPAEPGVPAESAAAPSSSPKEGVRPGPRPVPSVQDRRAAAEAAFRAMWKPKHEEPESAEAEEAESAETVVPPGHEEEASVHVGATTRAPVAPAAELDREAAAPRRSPPPRTGDGSPRKRRVTEVIVSEEVSGVPPAPAKARRPRAGKRAGKPAPEQVALVAKKPSHELAATESAAAAVPKGERTAGKPKGLKAEETAAAASGKSAPARRKATRRKEVEASTAPAAPPDQKAMKGRTGVRRTTLALAAVPSKTAKTTAPGTKATVRVAKAATMTTKKAVASKQTRAKAASPKGSQDGKARSGTAEMAAQKKLPSRDSTIKPARARKATKAKATKAKATKAKATTAKATTAKATTAKATTAKATTAKATTAKSTTAKSTTAKAAKAKAAKAKGAAANKAEIKAARRRKTSTQGQKTAR